jgi:hypothetical protein
MHFSFLAATLLFLIALHAPHVDAYRRGGGGYRRSDGGYRNGGGGGGYRDEATYFEGARAVDGDTIQTRSGEYIRLRNVDAPELNERGGYASRAALQDAIDDGGYIQRVARDVYGRTVGYVFDSQGNDVGMAQVEGGYGKKH